MPTTSSNSSKHVRRRKIADLSEEQRERKRNTDRQAQQAFRERTKSQIQDLEDEIETMRRNAAESEDAWRTENVRLRERVRQLTHRLEQIKRLTTGQLDLGFGDTDPIMAGAEVAEPDRRTRQTSDSPGSMIVVGGVAPSPQHAKHDLLWETEPLKETTGTIQNDRVSPRKGSSHTGPGPSGLLPHANPSMPSNALESPTALHSQDDAALGSEISQDVLMSSYDVILSPDHASVTQSLHQWLPHPSMSAHSTSPGMMDHSLQYRREIHEVLCEHPRPTCPFDHILLDLINARKLILSDGSSIDEAIGPSQADIAGLFDSQKVQLSHPISRILVEMMHTFGHVNLPERAAFMYKIHKTLRVSAFTETVPCYQLTYTPQWHISPDKKTYSVLPSWLRPTAKQIIIPHAAWIDNIPW